MTRKSNPLQQGLCVLLSFASLFVGLPPDVWAGPEGAQVVNGQVQIQQQGSWTMIQASDRAIIQYSGFDIQAHETVQFLQPSAAAWVLNRVNSASPTSIYGSLLANGRVALVNPAGVYFGPSARVDVNQLLASSLNLSDASFLSGSWEFLDGTGSVVNEGLLKGDRLLLVGRNVVNRGTLMAADGMVLIAAGERVLLRDEGEQVYVEVDGMAADALREAASSAGVSANGVRGTAIENEGEIAVGSGQVTLLVGDQYAQAFRNLGRVAASVTVGPAGSVEVAAASGRATNQGTIEANSAEAGGGRVQVDAPEVVNEGIMEAGGGEIGLHGRAIAQAGLLAADTVGDHPGRIEVVSTEKTVVTPDSLTRASGGDSGNGGVVLIDSRAGWTKFLPGAHIEARGGDQAGDGGFVEISAETGILIGGTVDTLAPQGQAGTLLIDPTSLNIINGAGPGDQDAQLPDIFGTDANQPQNTVAEQALENLSAATNIFLEITTGTLTLEDLADNTLALKTAPGLLVTFRASSTGSMTFQDVNDTVQTSGGNITLDFNNAGSGGTGTLGRFTTNGGNFSGDFTGAATFGTVNAGGGTLAITGQSVTLGGGMTSGGAMVITANNGSLNLQGNTLTSNSSMTLQALGTGNAITNATGAISVGISSLLTVKQNGSLTIGGGGVNNIQNRSAVNLSAESQAGSVTFADAATWEVLTATVSGGTGNIVLLAPQSTDAGDITFSGNTGGDIDLGGQTLTSNDDMSLNATGSGGEILNAAGGLTIAENRTLTLNQNLGLTLGTGGVVVLNPGGTNLVAFSNAGTTIFNTATTWNSLAVTAGGIGFNIIVNAAQATDTGDLSLVVSTGGDIDLTGRTLTAAEDLTLQTTGTGGEILNATGGLTVGDNRTLTLSQNASLTVGGGGVVVLNTPGTNLVASSNGGSVNLANSATWNSLSATVSSGSGSVIVQQAQTTDSGNLTLTAGTSGGNVDLGGLTLTSALNMTLSAQGSGGSILNAAGGLSVGNNSSLSLRVDGSYTIGGTGINVLNTADVNLDADSDSGTITLASATTWNSLDASASGSGGILVQAAQTTDSGNLAFNAGSSGGNVDLGGQTLTSAQDMTLGAQGSGGGVLNATGGLSVGVNRTLTVRNDG
ncbi:MAG: filamentous hemagglutinin N-terminal domain-containing protein, partial [Planctomycetes bacterium]|nr:filamentous hemagglutinin N-terminal domain-containing protein [Planctomycetota bacterium]